jgi:hypothetical protein
MIINSMVAGMILRNMGLTKSETEEILTRQITIYGDNLTDIIILCAACGHLNDKIRVLEEGFESYKEIHRGNLG